MTASGDPTPEDRPLLYSERKRLADTGSLGEWVYDRIPEVLGIALRVAVSKGSGYLEHFAWPHLTNECFDRYGTLDPVSQITGTAETARVFDVLELKAASLRRAAMEGLLSGPDHDPSNFDRRISYLFNLHRLGYVMDDGLIRSVSSPAMDAVAVGPALIEARVQTWEKAEVAYQDALVHLRGGENAEALTAANAAVEAALKAMGLEGDRLNPLLKNLKGSGHIPSYAAGIPEAVVSLANRLMAMRGQGDAHGSAPDADEPPAALAALAVHWAGAIIVYLSAISDRGES